jgi:hypothetical protein
MRTKLKLTAQISTTIKISMLKNIKIRHSQHINKPATNCKTLTTLFSIHKALHMHIHTLLPHTLPALGKQRTAERLIFRHETSRGKFPSRLGKPSESDFRVDRSLLLYTQ